MSRNFWSKKEYMENIFEIILGYINEKLQNTVLVLEILNRRSFRKLAGKSLKDIRQLKRDLAITAKETIKLERKRYESRANRGTAFKDKRSI